MSADDFFSRWSRRKQEAAEERKQDAAPDASVAPPAPAEALPPPTLDDVAALNHDADFRRFVAPGVDETVRRSAMKKLFTDPHFNVMDGLDIYIDDYNKFEPLPAAMLAMLEHAKPLLDPLGQLKQPVMRMLDLAPGQPQQEAQAEQGAPAHAEATSAEAAAQAPQDELESVDTVPPQPDAVPTDATAEAPPAEAPAPNPQDTEAPQDDHSI
ncbi:DUF3306 domain-containing protein|uniref:DUF3306 domain-containing protein n=1 Tax=Noviherbaspirillum sp. L7-7A TaxID=2850560 RepID=UPI001C2BED35|nr:DUF3306 domain-containing protein [Noviherbaspirillum sp. L7-7A]MBV0878516.1 DUF3306 domain-containing protein [Noviherbaspirillum sp. L7-7A]